MGQYHKPVNLDKREFLHPHYFGDGLKLREQASSTAGTVAALHILLAASSGRGGGDYAPCEGVVGRWAGDRVAMVGDYIEDKDIPSFEHASQIYNLCANPKDYDEKDLKKLKNEFGFTKKDFFKDISEPVAAYMEDALEIIYIGDGWRQVFDMKEVVEGWEYSHGALSGNEARVARIDGVDYPLVKVKDAVRAEFEKLTERRVNLYQWKDKFTLDQLHLS